ncbi:MAG: DUF805 domain-containing protein [Hellea sp.]|nr:DUF805 domain-containing protein [Hellea sp.]
MFKLLFNPEGRIGPDAFAKGAVILLALNFVLWLGWYVSLGVGILASLIALITVYCWACLFTKRFHDAGLPGWGFPLILLAFYVLVSFVFAPLLSGLFSVSPEAVEAYIVLEEFQNSDEQPTTMEEIQPVIEALGILMKSMAIRSSIVFFISGAILAFGINKFLKTDPEPNRWG